MLDIRCPSNHEELPATMEEHDAVAIFGGPMSANDDHTLPFIRTELNWIPTALNAGKPLLGICLGAQLLARVLGATVAPHSADMTEIGYFPIVPTPSGQEYFNGPLNIYHWNREGFELPQGSVLLAAGATFSQQAFRYNETAYGLQFHPEVTGAMVDKWTTLGAEQLTLPGAQSRDEQLQRHIFNDQAVEDWLKGFVDVWLDPFTGRKIARGSLRDKQLTGNIY